MTKQNRKHLKLSVESVRQISTDDLRNVAGGLPPPRTEIRSVCICTSTEWC
jgi:hypothetical protein